VYFVAVQHPVEFLRDVVGDNIRHPECLESGRPRWTSKAEMVDEKSFHKWRLSLVTGYHQRCFKKRPRANVASFTPYARVLVTLVTLVKSMTTLGDLSSPLVEFLW
jgi:hypothetical protein